MNKQILDYLAKARHSFRVSKGIPELERCTSLLDSLVDYIEDPSSELDIYTHTDLDIAIYRARSSDSEKIKELSIIVDELKRSSAAHKTRADHFERVCGEHVTTIVRLQTEVSKMSLTVIKHQRNSEASQSELNRMKREFEEVQKVNASMAASISSQERASTLENSTLKARVDSLQKSLDDYSNAFKSTKRKLVLARRQHMNLLGMSESESPMGQELDTTSLEWGDQGITEDTHVGSLLSSDGREQSVQYQMLTLNISGTDSCIDEMLDLSDANCLV